MRPTCLQGDVTLLLLGHAHPLCFSLMHTHSCAAASCLGRGFLLLLFSLSSSYYRSHSNGGRTDITLI